MKDRKYTGKGKNNSGFSLVELVVVILIMAIVAVAMAPQVMKWVKNSRNATDVQTKNDLYRMCSVTLGDKEAFSTVQSGGYSIVLKKTSASSDTQYIYSGGTDGSGKPDLSNPYWKHLFEVASADNVADFESRMSIKSSPENGTAIEIKVEIYENGGTNAYISGISNDDIDIS